MTDHQPGQPQYGPPPEYPPFPPPIVAVEQPPKKKPVPQWAVGIAAGVIVLCALCGIGGIAVSLLGGDEKPAAQTAEATPTVTAEPAVEKPTAEPEEAPDLPDEAMELVFVQVLRDSGYPAFSDLSDDELVLAGRAVCIEIGDEGLLERMVRLANDPDVDPNAAGYLTGAAVSAFCPEFQDDMDAFNETYSGG